MIRTARPSDAQSICDIYNPYIQNNIYSFEEDAVSEAQMRARICATSTSYPWFVYERGNQIIGYAYAGLWQQRHAYRHTVISTVYLSPEAAGQGIGSALYRHLIDELRSLSVHAIVGGISLPNHASVALHEKFGFEKIAHFREVGQKFGRWIDVGYWQLLLK